MSIDSDAKPRARHVAQSARTGVMLGERYELTDRIAVGGMGEVWQARDRHLGRLVAVKVMRPELVGDELFLARLRTEARNTAGLRHRNLAMLLDHGEEGRTGYLVMELVDGETLADRLRQRGRLPAEEFVPILIQACRGLHAAHAAGVVHRDVKPANVMITPDGLVKLTDFGISLAANQAPMTSTGKVMGTAHYLAPEQATGHAATPAGDVYALGVLAYEALTGARPFTGTTQVDVAFAHVNEPVPPLPASVPCAVAAVVTSMLAKDPTDRPASALRCAEQLERTPALRPVAASPRWGVPGVVGHLTPPVPAPRDRAVPTGPTPSRRLTRQASRTRQPTRSDRRPARRRPPSWPRWQLPTWQELSADRVWLIAMAVVTAIVVVLAALTVTIGNLDGADPADDASASPRLSVNPTIVRTSSG